MNTDPRRPRPARGPENVAAGDNDPFQHIGRVARPGPQLEEAADEPEPPQADSSEQEQPLQDRAAAVMESATTAIVDNIDKLIRRAERLKASIIKDNAEVKARITANLNHGAKILELSKRMDSELDELEKTHAENITVQS